MSERRLLYLCPTLLSLMNSIVTQMTVNKDTPADLVLEDTSDFSEIVPRLKRHGIFERIESFPYLEDMPNYRPLSPAQKHRVEKKPSLVFHLPQLAGSYTDLCVNLDTYAPKFFYYGLLERGMRPAIHFVSEGTGTYALDFSNTARDGMDHDAHGDLAFRKKTECNDPARPEIYTGGADDLKLIQLPNYAEFPPEVPAVLEDVFGKTPPIGEKLIFFEGAFWGDGMLTNEIELFLAIAEHIGQDNIIVKRHPRNPTDRFTPLGFKVMPQQSVPWEIMIKDIDLSKKALVSVASFTCFSSMEMYGRPSYSLLLENVMRGRVNFLEDPGYRRFFRQAEKYFNSERIVSWRPQSIRELKIALDVIGERIGGWNA